MRNIFLAATLLLFASAAFADSITVTLATASLMTKAAAGPYTLDFQFIDGSGLGDSDNTVTLSNFLVTGGSIGSPSSITGGVTTKTSPFSITMTDSSFFNEAQVPYTPGATLSFEATYTTNADPVAPDSFTFAILNGSGNEIPTNNPNFNDAFLEVDLPTTSASTSTTASSSSDGTIPAPVVLPLGLPPVTTPEPASVLLILAAIPLFVMPTWWRGRSCRLRSLMP